MHAHPASPGEPAIAPSGEGTVVLDIGGDNGAAVVYAPEGLAGEEIEIRAEGRPWDGTHTGVRRRDVRDAVCYAGVFGTLPAGGYQLRLKGTETDPVLEVAVVGGEITEVAWPAN